MEPEKTKSGCRVTVVISDGILRGVQVIEVELGWSSKVTGVENGAATTSSRISCKCILKMYETGTTFVWLVPLKSDADLDWHTNSLNLPLCSDLVWTLCWLLNNRKRNKISAHFSPLLYSVSIFSKPWQAGAESQLKNLHRWQTPATGWRERKKQQKIHLNSACPWKCWGYWRLNSNFGAPNVADPHKSRGCGWFIWVSHQSGRWSIWLDAAGHLSGSCSPPSWIGSAIYFTCLKPHGRPVSHLTVGSTNIGDTATSFHVFLFWILWIIAAWCRLATMAASILLTCKRWRLVLVKAPQAPGERVTGLLKKWDVKKKKKKIQ